MFLKNSNIAGGHRVFVRRTWNVYPGVLKKERMWKFLAESIKKQVESPGMFKKKVCGISVSLGFWGLGISSQARCGVSIHTISQIFQR